MQHLSYFDDPWINNPKRKGFFFVDKMWILFIKSWKGSKQKFGGAQRYKKLKKWKKPRSNQNYNGEKISYSNVNHWFRRFLNFLRLMRVRMESLTLRSICLKIAVWEAYAEIWNRLFLSFHMWNIVVWIVSLMSVALKRLDLESIQSLNCICFVSAYRWNLRKIILICIDEYLLIKEKK